MAPTAVDRTLGKKGPPTKIQSHLEFDSNKVAAATKPTTEPQKSPYHAIGSSSQKKQRLFTPRHGGKKPKEGRDNNVTMVMDAGWKQLPQGKEVSFQHHADGPNLEPRSKKMGLPRPPKGKREGAKRTPPLRLRPRHQRQKPPSKDQPDKQVRQVGLGWCPHSHHRLLHTTRQRLIL
jgi:hypothetical protein